MLSVAVRLHTHQASTVHCSLFVRSTQLELPVQYCTCSVRIVVIGFSALPTASVGALFLPVVLSSSQLDFVLVSWNSQSRAAGLAVSLHTGVIGQQPAYCTHCYCTDIYTVGYRRLRGPRLGTGVSLTNKKPNIAHSSVAQSNSPDISEFEGKLRRRVTFRFADKTKLLTGRRGRNVCRNSYLY